MLSFPYLYKNKPPCKIVTWANGTYDELQAMLDAHDRGLLTIYDYWSVGDERTEHINAITADDKGFTSDIPAQDVTMVLMNAGYAGKENSKIHFVVGQKECLSVAGRMNDTDTNTGGWAATKLKESINSTYWNALSTDFKNITQRGNVWAATSTISIDSGPVYATLPAEFEIYGSVTNSAEFESRYLSQLEYYKTAANRQKTYGMTTTKAHWWLRSLYITNSTSFCGVSRTGGKTASSATQLRGIAPIMFI